MIELDLDLGSIRIQAVQISTYTSTGTAHRWLFNRDCHYFLLRPPLERATQNRERNSVLPDLCSRFEEWKRLQHTPVFFSFRGIGIRLGLLYLPPKTRVLLYFLKLKKINCSLNITYWRPKFLT